MKIRRVCEVGQEHLKENEFDRKSQSGELSLYRRQGLPITSGPGGCFVVEFPVMFVRVGD